MAEGHEADGIGVGKLKRAAPKTTNTHRNAESFWPSQEEVKVVCLTKAADQKRGKGKIAEHVKNEKNILDDERSLQEHGSSPDWH